LYYIQFSNTSQNLVETELFISKDMMNNGDINAGDSRLLCLTRTTSYETSVSATAYLLNTDYINLAFFLISGTMASNTRSVAQITLIQRTA
jgi:hypothetical protein